MIRKQSRKLFHFRLCYCITESLAYPALLYSVFPLELPDHPDFPESRFQDVYKRQEHNGIDVKGILRAGMKALTTGDFSEGASTITQQLLKNNVFTLSLIHIFSGHLRMINIIQHC